MEITFNSTIWLYPGNSAWHFITIPSTESKEIQLLFGTIKKPFGSLPVVATIGETCWNTSIFWDSKQNSFLLPVKSEVRKKEKLIVDTIVVISLSINI